MMFEALYQIANEKLNPREISVFINAGSVACAILTKSGHVYCGVCIDTACTLGMCAERNAIANMITNNESHIVKLVCVMSGGKVLLPCGACREFLMQLHKESGQIEILKDPSDFQSMSLNELLPQWWGHSLNE